MLADKKAQIIPVQELLSEKLVIPKYQRPYKWTKKNIDDLLGATPLSKTANF